MTANGPVQGVVPPAPVAPSLRRRSACLLYEGVLLFGLVVIVGLFYGVLADQRHALRGHLGLQISLFVVIGAYFVAFWSRGGQTLAMKTWHIRLVGADGGAVSARRALLRYLLAWVWFVPALAALWASGIRSTGASVAVVVVGMVAYAALTRLRADRQYWHDVVSGTRLVDARPTPPISPASSR